LQLDKVIPFNSNDAVITYLWESCRCNR